MIKNASLILVVLLLGSASSMILAEQRYYSNISWSKQTRYNSTYNYDDFEYARHAKIQLLKDPISTALAYPWRYDSFLSRTSNIQYVLEQEEFSEENYNFNGYRRFRYSVKSREFSGEYHFSSPFSLQLAYISKDVSEPFYREQSQASDSRGVDIRLRYFLSKTSAISFLGGRAKAENTSPWDRSDFNITKAQINYIKVARIKTGRYLVTNFSLQDRRTEDTYSTITSNKIEVIFSYHPNNNFYVESVTVLNRARYNRSKESKFFNLGVFITKRIGLSMGIELYGGKIANDSNSYRNRIQIMVRL